jgi:hypothetical protein
MVFLKLVHTEYQVNHKTVLGQGGPAQTCVKYEVAFICAGLVLGIWIAMLYGREFLFSSGFKIREMP